MSLLTCGFKSRRPHHFSLEKDHARVVELADSLDSGSSVLYGRAGSSPASRTKRNRHERLCFMPISFIFQTFRKECQFAENGDCPGFLPLFYHPPDSARRGRRRASPPENWEKFLQRVQKYKDLDERTPCTLRELVKGVYTRIH